MSLNVALGFVDKKQKLDHFGIDDRLHLKRISSAF